MANERVTRTYIYQRDIYVHKSKRGGNLFSHGKLDFIQGMSIYFDCCSSSVFTLYPESLTFKLMASFTFLQCFSFPYKNKSN